MGLHDSYGTITKGDSPMIVSKKNKLRCDWDENDAKYVWYCDIRPSTCVHLYCKDCMKEIANTNSIVTNLKHIMGVIS